MPNTYDRAKPLMMSAEILLGSEQAAREIGLDLSESLVTSDLTKRQMASGEDMVPLHKIVAFLNDAAARSNCEHFGLLIAKHQPAVRFAMIGQLVRFSENLGMAINDAVRFSLLNSEFTRWELERHGELATLTRHTRVAFDAPMFQMRTLAIALVYKAINAICQRRVPLYQVNFSVAPPQRPDRFEQFFEAPVLFNQMESSLVISAKTLELPIPTADSRVRVLLIDHLEQLTAAQSPTLSTAAMVRLHIQKTVGSRHCTLEGLCANWGVHPRALQRSLKESGTSFRRLLLDVRQELAEQYLRDTSISVAELSDILGYQNPSAFSRAFKLCSGTSPDIWRSSQKGMPNVG